MPNKIKKQINNKQKKVNAKNLLLRKETANLLSVLCRSAQTRPAISLLESLVFVGNNKTHIVAFSLYTGWGIITSAGPFRKLLKMDKIQPNQALLTVSSEEDADLCVQVLCFEFSAFWPEHTSTEFKISLVS